MVLHFHTYFQKFARISSPHAEYWIKKAFGQWNCNRCIISTLSKMFFTKTKILKGLVVAVTALGGFLLFKALRSNNDTQAHASSEAKTELVGSSKADLRALPAEAQWIEDEGQRFQTVVHTQFWDGKATGANGLPFWKLQEMVQDTAYPFEEVWGELQKYSPYLIGYEDLVSSLMRRCILSGDGITALKRIDQDMTSTAMKQRLIYHLYDKRPPDSSDPLFKKILDVVTDKNITLSDGFREQALRGLSRAMEGDPLERKELWRKFASIKNSEAAFSFGWLLSQELSAHHPEYRSAEQVLPKLNELLAEWSDTPISKQFLEGSLLALSNNDPMGSLQLEIDHPSTLPDSVLENVANKLQRSGKYSVLLEHFDSFRGTVSRNDLFADWAENDLNGLKDWLDTNEQSASTEEKDHAKANLLENALEPGLEGLRSLRQEIANLDTAEVRSHHLEKIDQLESQYFVAEFNERPSEILGSLIEKDSSIGTAAASEVIQHYLHSFPTDSSQWLQTNWHKLPPEVQTRVAQESAANALENGHTALAKRWLDSLPQTESE